MASTPAKHHSPAPKEGSPDNTALPRLSQNGDQQPSASGHNRSSFGFLRRKSSGDTRAARSASGSKMSKKQKALAQEEALRKQREAAMLPKSPPRLPSHSPLPQIQTFGGEEARPDSLAIMSNDLVPSSSHNFSRPSGEHKMQPAPAPANVPVPPIPASVDSDSYPRAESMTHRGRLSYASSAFSSVNSPRRVRRRKDPTPFNVLVLGTKGSGKSSFIDFLRVALALPAKKRPHTPSPPPTAQAPDSPFTSQYLETEVDGERVGLTLWDSQGLEKNIVDFQLPAISAFLESKFEDTFSEEQKVVRAPGVRDTHIHAVFMILDPLRLDANIAESKKTQSQTGAPISGLTDELDMAVLRELQPKTAVIPVISKADTITSAHMRYLKKMVWDTLRRAKLDPLEALNLFEESGDEEGFDERDEDAYVQSDHDEKSDILNKIIDRSSSEAASDTSSIRSGSQSPPTSPPSAKKNHVRKPSAMSASINSEGSENPFLPLSIISPDPYEPEVVGRKFPWGFADPYNAEHCDFVKLRENVFSEWRAELREASREQWYEGWRTQRLQKVPDKRRVTSAAGVYNRQPSVPTANGRASSAGRDARQHRSVPC
ncbi:hypothetical protein P280DRAFT_251777 [Massarina eburnea CBS 473.64]|uniref:Septin-type G domain-containing protein n=1 Tax=Massarina eburnea CBS 473.64 TaxID=1395130 RepID=A0A6A6S863_9PLEO|nr:hypothetical protein P280DRAFT_251777 [Massarina eburnea CBS 473.64]